MLTIADIFEYVGVEPEYADEVQKRRAVRALRAARMWIIGAVGKRHDLCCDPYGWLDWPLAEETMLMAAGEMYETRIIVDTNLSKYAGSKAAASLNRLAFDAINQLKYCEPPMRVCCRDSDIPEDKEEDFPPVEDIPSDEDTSPDDPEEDDS